eukprot:scaffold4805_cov229-Prasinococcus_capsulatus_cf.AAC.2
MARMDGESVSLSCPIVMMMVAGEPVSTNVAVYINVRGCAVNGSGSRTGVSQPSIWARTESDGPYSFSPSAGSVPRVGWRVSGRESSRSLPGVVIQARVRPF